MMKWIRHNFFKKRMKYCHVRDLLSGGNTSVFLAGDGDEYVVVKQAVTKSGSKQMLREYEALTKLKGTVGIIDLESHFMERNRFTLVYPYFPNGDMLEVLDSGVILNAKSFARAFLQTMQEMHDRGFAHRDIKPENVVFDAVYNFKLIDFGMATNAPTSRETLGTKNYCAPEVFAANEYSCSKADIWSFGAMMIVAIYRRDTLTDGRCDEIDFPVFWKAMDEKVSDPVDAETKRFLERALQPASTRPSARELLMDPWLKF